MTPTPTPSTTTTCRLAHTISRDEPLQSIAEAGTHSFYNSVIGFGFRLNSGKTLASELAADILNDHDKHAIRLSYADGVKDVARYMGWDSNKDDKGRKLLQIIGTEAGRTYDNDMWVKQLIKRVHSDYGNSAILIIDDCRFQNEVDFVKRHGHAFRIDRQVGQLQPSTSSQHASETMGEGITWCGTLTNQGTSRAEYHTAITHLLKNWGYI